MTTDFWKDKGEKWLQVFDRIIRHRVRHYRTTFNPDDPSDRAVLKDIAKFCRASETTIAPTVEQTYALIGRREVWLRIQQHLNLAPETLTDIALGPIQEKTYG